MSRKSALGGALLALISLTLFASTPLGLKTVLKLERMVASLKDNSKTVGDVDWHWSERGSGEPLVLLHGFAGNRNHWSRVVQNLEANTRILIPDLPGFGESIVIGDSPDYGADQQLTRLIQWLDALKIRKAHIGGHSMGGRIAFLFASRFPDRVLSIYLMCPSGIAEGRTSEFHRILSENGVNLALPEDMEQFDELNAQAFEKMPWIPPPLYRQLGRDLIVRRSLHQKIWEDLKRPAMSLELLTASLPPVPITTIWGKKDRLLSPTVVPILKAALPHMNDELLPGIGHMPLVEAPALTAASVTRHLKRQIPQ